MTLRFREEAIYTLNIRDIDLPHAEVAHGDAIYAEHSEYGYAYTHAHNEHLEHHHTYTHTPHSDYSFHHDGEIP